MSGYCIPSVCEPHTTELVIKRSRFLTQAIHAPGLACARAFVEQVRKKWPDARHNCWACVGGAAGESGQAGCSDDGEPHGTAGRPMLQILLHSKVGEVCMVVTRWFGGIKLGTGGLVRAYQDSVRLNLESLPCVEKQECCLGEITLSYAEQPLYERTLLGFGCRIVERSFGSMVTIVVELPKEDYGACCKMVAGLGKGARKLLLCEKNAQVDLV